MREGIGTHLTGEHVGRYVVYDDGFGNVEVGRIKDYDNYTRVAYVVYRADAYLDTVEEWKRYTGEATPYHALTWRDSDTVTSSPPRTGESMTPQELSDEVGEIVKLAQARVGPDSIGAQQDHVEGRPQKFETMPLDGLVEYMAEEALDLINYSVMLSIRARRLQAVAETISNPLRLAETLERVALSFVSIEDGLGAAMAAVISNFHKLPASWTILHMGRTASLHYCHLRRFPFQVGDRDLVGRGDDWESSLLDAIRQVEEAVDG